MSKTRTTATAPHTSGAQTLTVRTAAGVDARIRAGFVFTPDPRTVEVDAQSAALIRNDPYLRIAEAE